MTDKTEFSSRRI